MTPIFKHPARDACLCMGEAIRRILFVGIYFWQVYAVVLGHFSEYAAMTF